MNVLVDTNVIRYLLNDEKRANTPSKYDIEAVDRYLKENDVVISYGTVFEIFNSYRRHDKEKDEYFWDWSSIKEVHVLLNRYQFQFFDPFSDEYEEYKTLLYESTWNKENVEDIYCHLLLQCQKYNCNVLTQIYKTFAILYMNVKLNKSIDDYSLFVKLLMISTNNIENAENKILSVLKSFFENSYTQNYQQFCDIVNEKLGRVVNIIEKFYAALNHQCLDLGEFCKICNETYKNYCDDADTKKHKAEIKSYSERIKDSVKELKTGKKHFSSPKELYSYMNVTELPPIEIDFIRYCMKQFFEKFAKFKYNDIIDFMNASLASKNGFQYLTFDEAFVKTLSEFESEQSRNITKNAQELLSKFQV